MPTLEISFEGRDETFTVRHFRVQMGLSSLFTIGLMVRSEHDDADLDALTGCRATFRVALPDRALTYTAICAEMELVAVESTGLSTYHLTLVPELWRLSQRRDHRVFQQLTAPQIVARVLEGWGIEAIVEIDQAAYPRLDYRVQYGETDFAFFSRVLEEAGITYCFRERDGATRLVLTDAPQRAEPTGDPLPFVGDPSEAFGQRYATRVYRATHTRPGAHRITDHDLRNPSFPLAGAATPRPAPEDVYEQHHYQPGASEIDVAQPDGDTPVADARGAVRSDQATLDGRAQRALDAARVSRKRISFGTTALELIPGSVTSISGHPRSDLGAQKRLLVTSTSLEGVAQGDVTLAVQAVFAERPYRPALSTPRPIVHGLQCAVVVGPKGEEIHTDEFGRVRVQFFWDREGARDQRSSCWVRVSHGWAGAGYGTITIPRVGHEVLVGFLEGDPDQPVVVGSLYNRTQQVPYKLPEHRTVSTWKSSSSPGKDGFNELKFEDKKGEELVYLQAQRNLFKLVRRHEREMTRGSRSVRIGGDLGKVVGGDEAERTRGSRVVTVEKDLTRHVLGDETAVTDGAQRVAVVSGQDLVVRKYKKERVMADSHRHVDGDAMDKVDGSMSLLVGGDQQEKVAGRYAKHVGDEIHLKAGSKLVLEAGAELVLKGPGGFVAIGPSGVAIEGTLVKINCGAAAGSGSGASPTAPLDAAEATIEDAEPPEVDEKK